MPKANEKNSMHDPFTSSDSEFWEFVDPPGGAPLDDPEVLARKRCGRPADQQKPASSDEQNSSSAE